MTSQEVKVEVQVVDVSEAKEESQSPGEGVSDPCTSSSATGSTTPRVTYAPVNKGRRQHGRRCTTDDDEEGEEEEDDDYEDIRVFPAALLLRLRVTQIVCGILVALLGTVACIEERGGRFRVGVGVVAGLAGVAAAGANIHASRYIAPESIGWSYGVYSGHVRAGLVLSALWTATAIGIVAMAVLVFMAMGSGNKNLIIIGTLEVLLSGVVLGISFATVWICRRYNDVMGIAGA